MKCGAQLPDDAVFCSRCGASQSNQSRLPQQSGSLSNSVQVLAPSTATSLKCPSCGAPIAPKFGEMIITCEYCGSSVTLGSSGWANIQKQTMLPLRIQGTDDISARVRSMMDTGLLHRHLQESSTLEEMNLSVAIRAVLAEVATSQYGTTDKFISSRVEDSCRCLWSRPVSIIDLTRADMSSVLWILNGSIVCF